MEMLFNFGNIAAVDVHVALQSCIISEAVRVRDLIGRSQIKSVVSFIRNHSYPDSQVRCHNVHDTKSYKKTFFKEKLAVSNLKQKNTLRRC